MRDLLLEWFNSGKEQLKLFEGEDELILHRHAGTLQLSVQLTHHRPDHSQLNTWMRLGGASLIHFPGALAQAPTSGALWLIQCLRAEHGIEPLLNCLQSLLNQRDAWRATATRIARPAHNLKPVSLRSLSY